MSGKISKRIARYAFRRAALEVQLERSKNLTKRMALVGERMYREIAERTQDNHKMMKKLWKVSNHRERGALTRKMKAMFAGGSTATA